MTDASDTVLPEYASLPRPVTRFAPSPTGYLHIGGARTALFNWLYARHHGGSFLLRIEDTDRARSTDDAIAKIIDGMDWLGLTPDRPPLFQFARADRHAAIAHRLLAEGKAYRCHATAQELEAMREEQKAKGLPQRYDGRWRDRTDTPDLPYVVRLKAPQTGETVIEDQVQGRVAQANAELDDFVLLRSDGTPTYMLAVVVDDHDMAVSHVIRGDDHLTNTFRQLALIRALGWPEPVYAHVPMIHGPDGAKLSKRHGALGVEAYRDEMGILPEALENYLLRLGWAHGDTELVARDEAVTLFDLDGVGRSPGRFDLKKLESVNAHYMKQAANERLVTLADAHRDPGKQGEQTIGSEVVTYCTLTRERVAGLRVEAPLIGVVLSGAKEIWFGEICHQLYPGDAFILPAKLPITVVNVPDERSGRYESLLMQIVEPPAQMVRLADRVTRVELDHINIPHGGDGNPSPGGYELAPGVRVVPLTVVDDAVNAPVTGAALTAVVDDFSQNP